MKTELDEWIEFTRAWVDEQQGIQDAIDRAAYRRFRAMLLGPFDDHLSDGRSEQL